MFNLSEFITKNIVNGVKNGTFTKEYANIMAVNYMLKGVLTEESVMSINSQIEAWESEQIALNTPVISEGEEITEDGEEVAETGEIESESGTSDELITDSEEDGEPLT